jgi:hypothetical protein
LLAAGAYGQKPVMNDSAVYVAKVQVLEYAQSDFAIHSHGDLFQ